MKRLIIVLLLVALFAFPSIVLADVAPPINPPGVNPQPGVDTTQVRMVSENVLINVNSDITPGSLGSARVTADFTMHNLGSSDESMAARFPISANDGRGQYPEITDLLIKVGGKQISYRRAIYPGVQYMSEDVPWAEFDVTFPVGQDVGIEVAYNLDGSGYAPYTAFYYILETGAGWKDTIGSADITLRLPYPASPQNIVLDTQIGWAETTPGGSIQGNEVHWHFENFEPGPYEIVQNMEFALVAPSAWQTVLKERDNVSKSPNDGEAWGHLAKAYKEIFFMNKGYRTDTGGEELYELSIEAYEKCLALLPKDAQWHAGFADLLASHSYWDAFMNNPTPETYRALDEIHTALQLAPNDAKVQEIAQNISYMFPDGMTKNGTGYNFPWLTQTPTPLPPTPTIAPVYDPAIVAGTYQSDLLTLANNKRAQLTLTLGTDHSATLESKGEDDQVTVSLGTWKDQGDGSIRVSVEDPNKKLVQLAFSLDGDNLTSIEYPGFYGEAGVNMKRLVTATATPEPPQTPLPSQPAPVPSSKPSLPFCGSAALAPLLVVAFWWTRNWLRPL
jgi:tetratricopeptide (TPR) repeat protein